MLLPILLLKHCPESQTLPLACTQARAWSDICPSNWWTGGRSFQIICKPPVAAFSLMVGWMLEHLSRCYAGCVWGRENMQDLGGACDCRCAWVMKTCACLRKELWLQDLCRESLEPCLQQEKPSRDGLLSTPAAQQSSLTRKTWVVTGLQRQWEVSRQTWVAWDQFISTNTWLMAPLNLHCRQMLDLSPAVHLSPFFFPVWPLVVV